MKEEELIRKLDNVELPEIELESHRRRLRMALLDAGYLKRQQGISIFELAKSKVKGVKETTIRGLVSRQPVWKPVVAGALAVALIAGLAIALPSLTRQSAEALAAEIAQNSPQVQAALNGEEIVEVEVITKVIDGEGNVLLVLVKTETRAVAAEMNLETKKVTEVIRVHVPEFTSADEQKSIDIARADPGIQELLAQGAVISKVSLGHSFISLDTLEVQGNVLIKLGGKEWHALIDLDEGRVVALRAPATGFTAFMNNLVYRIAALGIILVAGLLLLLGLATKNRLARAAAGITSIVFGIAGLFFGLYSMPSTAGALVLVLGIPIVGLVIGIIEIRRRNTKRWVAVIGVVICSIALVWDLVSIIASLLAGHGF